MPPDPAHVRIPGMLDGQERNTVFLKPLVTSPKIEIGEFTYYNDYDGAVVASDDAPYSLAGGNPARLIRRRFSDEDIARLLRIAWWDWPIDAITEHLHTIWAGTPAELEQAAGLVG